MKTARYDMMIYFTFAVMVIINTVLWADQSKTPPVSPASTDQFEIRNIEGCVVYIKKQDLVEHSAEMNKAIDHLQNQLYQIRLAVPAPAVAIMQQHVPMWMEYDSDPGMSFHPSYKCLCTRETNSTGGVYLVGTEKVRQNRF